MLFDKIGDIMIILAVGAHPDDIEFGCGGTLIKYAKKGHNVFLLVLTLGSFGGGVDIRRKEQLKAVKFIGVKDLFWGGFKDTELTDNRNLVLKIDEVIRKVNPEIVFLNSVEMLL